ncbi:hypothetical protein [Oceanidesulfovibrio marinus]|uniref:hypothetical protein n=1 Tax=Oceanidesulfovibrio marinus TaxID=370038 RepID=UPI0011858FF6|nr:hypothetical protein [Oceanidesulfovibrio marinus]
MKQYPVESFDEYDQLSSSFESFEFSSCRMLPSIDFLTFTVPFKEISSHSVSSFLMDNNFEITRTFHSKHDTINKCIQSQVRLKGDDGRTNIFGMFCSINPGSFNTTFKAINPDRKYFEHIINMTRNYSYSISKAEFTIDIYTMDNGKLFDFLSTHSYLLWSRSFFNVTDSPSTGTRYLNDIRNCNQFGGRIYIKDELDLSPVRIESYVKNRQFGKQEIKTISQAINMTADQVFKNWSFEKVDYNGIFRNITDGKISRNDYESGFLEAMNGNDNCGGLAAVRKYILSLKPGSYSYFKKHAFSRKFHRAIKNMNFVN